MLLNFPWDQNHPDTETRQRYIYTHTQNYMNTVTIILNKISVNWFQQYIKRTYLSIKRNLSQGCNIQDSLISKNQYAIHHTSKLKNKNHIVTSIDAERAFDKIQHSIMIKKKKTSQQNAYKGHRCACMPAQSWLTLCDPMDCSPPTPLSMEFSRQEHWSGHISFSRGSSQPRNQISVLYLLN